eukprot:Hpha_TRINITY_DN16052_c1_g1::TRINITY_DN16052_c1_g1_i1::g.119358::m.119358
MQTLTFARAIPHCTNLVSQQARVASGWTAFVSSRLANAGLKNYDREERKTVFKETQVETARLWHGMSPEEKERWKVVAIEIAKDRPTTPKKTRATKKDKKENADVAGTVKEKKPRKPNAYFQFHKDNFSRIYRQLEPEYTDRKELFRASSKRVKEEWQASK